LTNSLMGSEKSADQAWDLVSSWLEDMGQGKSATGTPKFGRM
jgi:hypothetical protein